LRHDAELDAAIEGIGRIIAPGADQRFAPADADRDHAIRHGRFRRSQRARTASARAVDSRSFISVEPDGLVCPRISRQVVRWPARTAIWRIHIGYWVTASDPPAKAVDPVWNSSFTPSRECSRP
jgi:hypothetical protein